MPGSEIIADSLTSMSSNCVFVVSVLLSNRDHVGFIITHLCIFVEEVFNSVVRIRRYA